MANKPPDTGGMSPRKALGHDSGMAMKLTRKYAPVPNMGMKLTRKSVPTEHAKGTATDELRDKLNRMQNPTPAKKR